MVFPPNKAAIMNNSSNGCNGWVRYSMWYIVWINVLKTSYNWTTGPSHCQWMNRPLVFSSRPTKGLSSVLCKQQQGPCNIGNFWFRNQSETPILFRRKLNNFDNYQSYGNLISSGNSSPCWLTAKCPNGPVRTGAGCKVQQAEDSGQVWCVTSRGFDVSIPTNNEQHTTVTYSAIVLLHGSFQIHCVGNWDKGIWRKRLTLHTQMPMHVSR